MSVKKDANGRRSVQVEVEVPGTPEEVWQAIASGPGISSWFVPTRFEEQGGKPVAVIMDFGPGMESTSKITTWDPPRIFAAQGEGWGGSPPMATEWSVEARAGGNCLVRVVHSLFASTDDWDNQLEGTESGWPGFFRILRIYLTHFRGQPSQLMQMMATTTDSETKAWATVSTALGLPGAKVGQHWKAAAGVPPLRGIIERLENGTPKHDVLLRLDEPAPGIASICVYDCGGPVYALISIYLYGDLALATVAKNKPLWQAWLQERFPTPKEAQKSDSKESS